MPLIMGILAQGVGAAPGAAGAYDLLETQVLSSSASSVTFTGLGSYSDYKHLQLRMTLRNSFASTGSRQVAFQLNSDATSDAYRYHRLYGDGSSVGSLSSTDNKLIWANSSANDSEASGIFGEAVVDLLDFASTNKTTTFRGLTGVNTSTNNYINFYSGLWNNTAAVTSITILEGNFNWVAGSRFSLYGVR